jgi:hypothetical protein
LDGLSGAENLLSTLLSGLLSEEDGCFSGDSSEPVDPPDDGGLPFR